MYMQSRLYIIDFRECAIEVLLVELRLISDKHRVFFEVPLMLTLALACIR